MKDLKDTFDRVYFSVKMLSYSLPLTKNEHVNRFLSWKLFFLVEINTFYGRHSFDGRHSF